MLCCLFVCLFVCCVSSHLVAKMKNVFEQVMLVDGTRRMRGDIIQKTFKVYTHIRGAPHFSTVHDMHVSC